MAFRRTIHVGLLRGNSASQIASLISDDPINWNSVDLDLEVPEPGTITFLSATQRGDYVAATILPNAGTPPSILRVWNRSGGNPYDQIANVAAVAGGYNIGRTKFSPDRQWLAVASSTASQGNSRVQIYSVANSGITLANTITGNTGYTGNMPVLSWTVNSDAVLVGGIYGPRVYDWSGSDLTLRSNAIYPAFVGNISSADFSADGESVAFASPGNVTVYDTTVTPWTSRNIQYDGAEKVYTVGGTILLNWKILGDITDVNQLPDFYSVAVNSGFRLPGSPDYFYIRESPVDTDWRVYNAAAEGITYTSRYPQFTPPASTLWVAGDVQWIGNVGLAVVINGNLAVQGNIPGRLEIYNWNSTSSTLTWNYQNYPWSGNGEPATMATNPTSNTVYLEGYRYVVAGEGLEGTVQVLEPTATSWTDKNYYTIQANVNIAGTTDTQSIVAVEGVLHQGNLDLQSTAVMRAQRTYVGNVDEFDDPYAEFGYMELGLVGQILRSRPRLQAVADTEETVVAGYIEPDYFFQVLTPGERIRASTADFESSTTVQGIFTRIRPGQSNVSSQTELSSSVIRIRPGTADVSCNTEISITGEILRRAQATIASNTTVVVQGSSNRDVSVAVTAETALLVTATRIQQAQAQLLSENFAAVTAQAQRNFAGDLLAETAMSVTGEAGYFGRANISVNSELTAFGFAPEILRATAHLQTLAQVTAVPTKIRVSPADLVVTTDLYVNAGLRADADAAIQVNSTFAVIGRVLQIIKELQLPVPEETRLYPVLAEYRRLPVPEETRLNSILPEVRGISVPQETRQEKVI